MASTKFVVEAVVLDPAGQVLLVRQGWMRHDWELPGGHVKKRESAMEAVIREVSEETGLTVLPERLLAVFHIREEKFHDFVFVCRLVEPAAAPRPNPPEIAACGFFAFDALPSPIRPFTVARIREALEGVTHALPIELEPGEWID